MTILVSISKLLPLNSYYFVYYYFAYDVEYQLLTFVLKRVVIEK